MDARETQVYRANEEAEMSCHLLILSTYSIFMHIHGKIALKARALTLTRL